MNELCNRVEAILFASGKGVTEEELINYCQVKPQAIKKALATLQQNMEDREGSLIISLHNNRWKMTVKGKYLKDVESIVSETELPSTILKTLAMIAYKSPVLQSDIIRMRGQSAYEHIKELVKQKFVTKEERGRSFLLKITDKFYTYFDVKGDEEIQEVFSKLREKQKTLGNLLIVDTTTQEKSSTTSKEDKEQLGELDIVNVAPKTKERTKEDEEKEKEFLNHIDTKINALSKRVIAQELPKREQTKPEEEDPLKVIEKLAKEHKEKEKDDYL